MSVKSHHSDISTDPQELETLLQVAEQALQYAKAAGASEADATIAKSCDFEVKVSSGKVETLSQATTKALGLRIFVDGKMGFCSTSDFRTDALRHAVERAVFMGREAAKDPFNGLPTGLDNRLLDCSGQSSTKNGDHDLELYDPAILDISADDKVAWAHRIEEAARAADSEVKKFRDSGVHTGTSTSLLVTSTGAIRSLRSSGISLWCIPIAERNGELQTESWFDTATHVADLDSPEQIGLIAAKRAARMLGAKAIPTQTVPIIFEPAMAAGFIGGIRGAIDGDNVFKKASFLTHKLGCNIANPKLNVMDDPHKKRGLASTYYDGEGLKTSAKKIINNGTLTTFLYDSYSAKKAGTQSTASAQRSVSGLPHAGTFNFYVEAGSQSPEEILSSVDKAFLVTRGMGSGVNTITGEYSRGAFGLWIEKGEIVHPVQEVTIAGDYLAILNNIDAIGNDLEFRGSSGAPTLRIAEMTVSGKNS